MIVRWMMEDAIKRLIDIVETLGGLEQKVDNILQVQGEMKDDLDLIKTCYTEHSERITKAEEKLKELDRSNGVLGKAVVTILLTLLCGVIAHMIIGGK